MGTDLKRMSSTAPRFLQAGKPQSTAGSDEADQGQKGQRHGGVKAEKEGQVPHLVNTLEKALNSCLPVCPSESPLGPQVKEWQTSCVTKAIPF